MLGILDGLWGEKTDLFILDTLGRSRDCSIHAGSLG